MITTLNEGREKRAEREVPMRVETEAQGLELQELEPWPEPVNGAALLEELEILLKRFVVLPERAAETIALWVLHTYGFELREVSTYLGIESPEKRCGKTTLLSVLAELASRPVIAANISSPAFFRVIQQTRPTLLIDEADTFLQGNDELRGILNSGYTRKTAYVVRVTNQFNQTDGYRRFSCWCPKVIAAIGRLPDTLADRCIVIRMQRKKAVEQCERLRGLEATDLKRKCLRFVADHGPEIAKAQPAIPQTLNDRAADIWEPLLALADLAGGAWPAKAREAAERLTLSAQESNPVSALLLDIVFLLSGAEKNRLFTRDLMAGLNSLSDRPWSEARKGRPITDIWLAQQLRPYGARPINIWIDGAQAKGFVLSDLAEVAQRYIPRAEAQAYIAEKKAVVENDQGKQPAAADAGAATNEQGAK